MRKETLVFLTSLAIIFIIGYVNMTMLPKNNFNDVQLEGEKKGVTENNIAEILENKDSDQSGITLVEVLKQTDTTDIAANQQTDTTDIAVNQQPETPVTPDKVSDEPNYEILGDITNILNDKTTEASSNGVIDMLNSSFAKFKLNKEKGNMDVIDHLEKSLSNESISADTKQTFEALLVNKSEFVEAEKNIELMLQSKGYNETAVIVDEDTIKVVTNDSIEQADATKILDVIVSETNFEPSQIKIVKFDNIDL